MFLWTLLMALVFLAAVGTLVFVFFRSRRFLFVYRLSQKRKIWGVLLPLFIVLLLAGAVLLVLRNVTYKPMNMGIVFIHLILIWLLCDLVRRIIHGKFVKGKRIYWQGALAIALTAAYMTYGWIAAHRVVRTDYALESGKIGDNSVVIAQISDSHVGATFHGAEFGEYMAEIAAIKPDIVVITGDYVDDDTTYEDMLICGEALEIFDCPVFFVYGNHDRGYLNSRGYGEKELIENLTSHGVIVLKDESYYLEDLNVTLVGREDRSAAQMSGEGRKDAGELTASVKPDSYIVILDHEPNDFDAEAAAGADLVLCGHTHGGQLIPMGYFGVLFGSNDAFYGESHRQNTTFIVNSGIGDWSVPFKTGCKAEYGIITISAGR